MRKNFGPKPWIYPQPVLIVGTYDENGKANAMNAAWGAVGDDTQVFLCLSPGHKTTENIIRRKDFTVSMGTRSQMLACDYVGVVSGKTAPDKMEKAGFHTHKGEFVDAPVIEELPLTLECRLISYDPESCHLFGEIINVSAEESVLTEGKPDPAKLDGIIFDYCSRSYRAVGEKVGNAFKDGLRLK